VLKISIKKKEEYFISRLYIKNNLVLDQQLADQGGVPKLRIMMQMESYNRG
jgi:hypothetical protein